MSRSQGIWLVHFHNIINDFIYQKKSTVLCRLLRLRLHTIYQHANLRQKSKSTWNYSMHSCKNFPEEYTIICFSTWREFSQPTINYLKTLLTYAICANKSNSATMQRQYAQLLLSIKSPTCFSSIGRHNYLTVLHQWFLLSTRITTSQDLCIGHCRRHTHHWSHPYTVLR